MPKCKICKSPFSFRHNTLEKTCQQYDCMVEFALDAAKKERERKGKEEDRVWSIRKKEMQFDNMSNDGYRSKVIQPLINEIARLIDYGQACIASGRYTGKMAGGHYVSVGSNRTVSLNLHNIHIQTFESNSFKSGDEANYRLGIIKIYGKEYFEFMDKLRYKKGSLPSKYILSELKPIITQISKDLKRNPTKLSPKERIERRNEYNSMIGIYLDEFIP